MAAARAAAPAAATEEELPRLELVWYDPELLVPVGFEALSRELEAIFREIGLRIALTRGSGLEVSGSRPLRVILVRRPAAAWNLGEDVMGVAPGSATPRENVYIIVPTVREVLGHDPESPLVEGGAESTEMSLALARIVAHELVHAVAPDHPHAADGLMRALQRRESLLKKKFRLDRGCVRAFRGALEKISGQG